jgi:hypothetical protein
MVLLCVQCGCIFIGLSTPCYIFLAQSCLVHFKRHMLFLATHWMIYFDTQNVNNFPEGLGFLLAWNIFSWPWDLIANCLISLVWVLRNSFEVPHICGIEKSYLLNTLNHLMFLWFMTGGVANYKGYCHCYCWENFLDVSYLYDCLREWG